jgi:hypothetical protein
MVQPLRANDSCRVKKIDEYPVENTLRLLTAALRNILLAFSRLTSYANVNMVR